MNYLLDANTFIEAKNRYYGMEICPAYWEWLKKAFNDGEIYSITFVKDELSSGNDELSQWVKEHSDIFMDISDTATQEAYTKVIETASAIPDIKQDAIDEFLRVADSWIIAKALVTGSTVVTHEAYNPAAKKRILIPNVCKLLNISYLNTFEMLFALDAEFVLA
ncbi:DUF4411 family protein [Vibrio breoganii]|uniref:DUF4411 family protein n=1 Tax=Vibrio breoganii TaxID=553239 RepID=UPI000C862563|nr:DUF4411 family protein [Vibrio breoganii]PML91929.1 hypothetical protein BCT64_16965 [Vibrio breoganii]PMN64230.1 hypothetical protein BCT28_08360 [Vibrio breoganii]